MKRRIRRYGRVLAAGDGMVEIRLEPDICGPCHEGRGCGAGLGFIAPASGDIVRLPQNQDGPIKAGTRVGVSLPEKLLERLSIIAYGAPLAGLLGGLLAAALVDRVLLARTLADHTVIDHALIHTAFTGPAAADFLSLLLVAAGLGLGIAAGRRRVRRFMPAALELNIESESGV